MKPEFIDNREGNTLLAALRGHLDWLAETRANPIELSIATGYFNPEGFGLLADRLERLPRVRLLLGAEPWQPPMKRRRKPGEPRGEKYNAKLVQEALQELEKGLHQDRDLLGFTPEIDATLKRLLSFLESGRIEVRRYEKAFMHGKAFLFAEEEGVLSGSSNFTAGGLTTNLELNLGHYEEPLVRKVKDWFATLWEEAAPYDLASIYEARFMEYDPYLIYLRVLWELWGEELEKEKGTEPRFRLATFQKDGLFRAKRILDEYDGVIIADGVGLGKTFLGGELLRETIGEDRQRALLIAPAALRDGTWRTFADRYMRPYALEKISFEELVADARLGGDSYKLKDDPENYALVVIDEAHALRNPDTKRAAALRLLLRGTPPKKLVFITATPVNNSLWDLYYLLTYFIGHDAAFAEKGIRSLKDRFAKAMDEDPYDLRPDILFDILDATTVRRTRHFVKRHYPHDRVPGADGIDIPIRFPEPHPKKVDYSFDTVLPGFFDEFAEKLAPENRDPELTLARYSPSRYRKGQKPDEREIALVGLLRSGLLKRFESSAYAFARTARTMVRSHDAFLAALNVGYVPTPEAIDEWTETDTDEAWERLLREKGAEPAGNYEVDELKADVEKDRGILHHFAEEAEKISREEKDPKLDPKLIALKEELIKIARHAEREGLDEEDERDKRKVLIFSYFVDTVDWIEEYLLDEIKTDKRLAPYRGRIASVTSEDSRHGISRDAAIFGFAPRSMEAQKGRDADLYDILITTDVLAEGMNLQQCRNIINFDLPWNPMRLVQRHGRIDRLGSPHKDVFIRSFFPDRRLDDLLDLERRVREKLARAAAVVGVESEVIPGGATRDVNFAETREEIEALRQEKPALFVNAGEDPWAHSGEEYRQELRKGLERWEAEIKALPWAAGSGFAGGFQKGHFFCARVGDHVFLRFVPFAEGEILRETLKCLRQITCEEDTRRHLPPDLAEGVYAAWARARHDIYRAWMEATDPKNLQPKVRPLFKRIADHLRRYPPPETLQDEMDNTLNAVEAPWGSRIESELRAVFEAEADGPRDRSAKIVDKVRDLGLEPFKAPEPLPVIEEDEVALVCWMAIDGPGDATL